MMRFLKSLLLAAAVIMFISPASAKPRPSSADRLLDKHVSVLQKDGKSPADYVLGVLETKDLILFDDALHNSVEPWVFYESLVKDPRFQKQVRYIFLEVLPVNRQPAIDAYFAAEEEDPSLLYPAFQDGFGWHYVTYFDFLHAVYEANRTLPENERFIVRAVSTPTLWKEIETREDWTLYNSRTVLGRDYDMYAIIFADLQRFTAGEKGVFLTNTRHAYTNIRKPGGEPYWNTGTFFRQWRPEKTWSVRFNAPILNVERETAPEERSRQTQEGLERYQFSWARVAKGLWDEAFKACGAKPVAIDLAKSPFGDAAYMGNVMHVAAPGQTMADAYDGVIFLTPLEDQKASASTGQIYTPVFKRELVRRYRIAYTAEELQKLLDDADVNSIEAYIDLVHADAPETLSSIAQSVGPMDEWRSAAP